MSKIMLALASISLLWIFCTPSNAQGKRTEPAVGKLPREAIGVGETVEKAKADALRDAAKTIKALMGMQKPALEAFAVDEKYVREQELLDTEKGHAGPDLANPLDEKQKYRQWVVPYRTDTDWWADLMHRDQDEQRKARAEERHTLSSRIMAGIAVLLLAGFGYIRLDEYTQRRYTTWLRIVGVGVATSVVAGWWYAFQG